MRPQLAKRLTDQPKHLTQQLCRTIPGCAMPAVIGAHIGSDSVFHFAFPKQEARSIVPANPNAVVIVDPVVIMATVEIVDSVNAVAATVISVRCRQRSQPSRHTDWRPSEAVRMESPARRPAVNRRTRTPDEPDFVK